MVMFRVSIRSAALALLMVAFIARGTQAQSPALAPGPTSDGAASIDQGIAYLLMLVALVLTYLIHPLDASLPSTFKFI